MSDYLSNLAAKSLNLTETIQPRLPSLFEPLSTAGGSAFGPATSGLEMAPDEPFSGETVREAPTAARGPDKPSTEPNPTMIRPQGPPDPWRQPPGSIPDPSTGWHSGLLASQAPSLLTSLPPVEARPESPAHPVLTPRPRIPGPTSGSISPPGTIPFPDREAILRPRPDTPGWISAMAGDEGSVTPAKSPGEPEDQPAPAPNLRSPRASTPATIIAQPRRISRIEPAAPALAEPIVTQEAAPLIRVTIGRVEVRAILSPPPAPRPTIRPSPTLSLEDYLKQREGGKR